MTCSIGHCTIFYLLHRSFKPLQIFKRFKKFNAFGIVENVRPTEILKWKILKKKEELKLKKIDGDLSFYLK